MSRNSLLSSSSLGWTLACRWNLWRHEIKYLTGIRTLLLCDTGLCLVKFWIRELIIHITGNLHFMCDGLVGGTNECRGICSLALSDRLELFNEFLFVELVELSSKSGVGFPTRGVHWRKFGVFPLWWSCSIIPCRFWHFVRRIGCILIWVKLDWKLFNDLNLLRCFHTKWFALE